MSIDVEGLQSDEFQLFSSHLRSSVTNSASKPFKTYSDIIRVEMINFKILSSLPVT